MSEGYNGWKNWATWACGLHFEAQDIIAEWYGNGSDVDDPDEFRDECVKRLREYVEETVREARDTTKSDDEPPVMELYNHTDEIDFEEIVDTALHDFPVLSVTGKILGQEIDDGFILPKDDVRDFLDDRIDWNADDENLADAVKEKLYPALDAAGRNERIVIEHDGATVIDIVVSHPYADDQPEESADAAAPESGMRP